MSKEHTNDLMIARKRAQLFFDAVAFGKDLGMQIDEIGDGWATVSMKVQPRFCQQHGFIHAGVLATLADQSAAGTVVARLVDASPVLTVEFKINYLSAAKGERIIAKTKLLKAGRTISVVETELFTEEANTQKFVAKATVTIFCTYNG